MLGIAIFRHTLVLLRYKRILCYNFYHFKDQSAPYDSKKDCWIPDKEEGYVAAQIVSTKGDQVTVTVKGSEVFSLHQYKYNKNINIELLLILKEKTKNQKPKKKKNR